MDRIEVSKCSQEVQQQLRYQFIRLRQKGWKRESGYHRRSLSETGIYRIKRIFGEALSSRNLESQNIETRLRCKAMNLMNGLGMPKTCPVT